jgi:osmoprotectant transport system substrate-binding protein
MASHRPMGFVVLVSMLAVLSACHAARNDHQAGSALQDDAITVGSFNFAESELLAEVYSQALTDGGYEVRRAFGLGPREFVVPALQSGLVELVPEYAGTAVEFLSRGASEPVADLGATHDALERTLVGSRVTALASAPASDANAVVVTERTADRLGLDRISDLATVASGLSFGGPPECPNRRFCLLGLEATYGLTFEEFVPLDVGGPLTRQALENGNVDVGLLFTTDPAVAEDGLVALEDDRDLQPAENVTPLVNREVLDRWGNQLVELVDGVSRDLTTQDLLDLNAQVESGRASIAAAAAAWLEERAA